MTGNPLDLALSGKGFFVLNGPVGPLYTRSGNFQVMPSGEIGTVDGMPLLGTGGRSIRVTSGKPITILKDGTVQQDGQSIGQVAVVTFKTTDTLRKTTSTAFEDTDPAQNPPAPATNVEVQEGKIEGSNVPVSEAAMRLVGVMRQFEMLQKAIGVSSDMDTKAIQEVARVTA